MIHYILLPAHERHALRREYRLRLAITVFLFISLAMVVGMVALLPSYVYTFNEETDALTEEVNLNNSRKASGADQIEKDLLANQVIAQKILAEEDRVDDTSLIERILSHRNKGINIYSFDISHIASSTPGTSGTANATAPRVASSTLAIIEIGGKADTRENFLAFQKAIDSDPKLADLNVPLSDLAQSKDITFTFKFTFIK